MARKLPNIVITGTPGVGKTTHAEQLAQATGLKHLSVNTIVKDEGFHEGKDEETGSWIVDEDKVCVFFFSLTLTWALASHIENTHTLTLFLSLFPAPRLPRNAALTLDRRLHPRLARV